MTGMKIQGVDSFRNFKSRDFSGINVRRQVEKKDNYFKKKRNYPHLKHFGLFSENERGKILSTGKKKRSRKSNKAGA